MAKSTTRDIVRICTEITRLDRKGKAEVLTYLQEALAKEQAKRNEKKEEAE